MKILILKLGYSETLDNKIDLSPSFGDIFRTTPILIALHNKYLRAEITWITDQKAIPLLKGIPLISRLLTWDSFLSSQLLSEKFDILINLEKTAAVCILADAIQAKKRYGFHFEPNFGIYSESEDVYQMVTNPQFKQNNQKSWQQMLIELIGCKWAEQPYQIRDTTETPKFDVGFNYLVGPKWPNKAWSIKNWKTLEHLLNNQGLTVSWQQGNNDIDIYVSWIESCKTLITNDSLGLHIALALKRYVVALFGPTSDREIYFYDHGTSLNAETNCRPCYQSFCQHGESCIDQIKPEMVFNAFMR